MTIEEIAQALQMSPEDLKSCDHGTKLYDARPRGIDPESQQEGRQPTHTPVQIVAWRVNDQWTTVNPFL